MSKRKVNIITRSAIVMIVLLAFAILIIAQILNVQYVHGNHYRSLAQKYTVKEVVVKANRGNIYADDRSVLATSVPKYDIAFDPLSPSNKVFTHQLDALCSKLSSFSGTPKAVWKRKFVKARKDGRRYVNVFKSLKFSDYLRVKNFPIFKLGVYKGGFIANLRTVRAYPLKGVLRRTIGYDKGQGNQVGIEGAYAKYLRGKDGMQKKSKIKYGIWKPLNDINEIDPQDGNDVVTNINVDIQDMAHQTLLNQLVKFEADHGTLVVMETQTGAIKAMVNLGKNKSGGYDELRNYAVYETHEPGSTFKAFSIMALLEDKLADTTTVVDTGKGSYKIYKKTVRDAHHGGMGKLTLKQVLEKSSNVGVVKMVYGNYKNQPKKFVKRMYNFGLHEKVGIDIKGEGKPIIPDPKDDNWSGISLPWMAYGYGVELTDLQVLTYYNAIANNGVVVKPYLVKEVSSLGKTKKEFEPEIINNSLASKETIAKMQAMLKGVVKRGTATNINSKYMSLAGKTGTAQTEYWKGKGQYIASFVGYFPADNPKYSMIVVIHKPNPDIGYYGNVVAAPVFQIMAEYIFGKMMKVQEVADIPEVKNEKPERILDKYKTIMPDVRGMDSKDALYVLENMGLKVRMSGSGTVKKQSVPRGEKINKSQIVELKLS